jgi:Transporter associated domain
MREDGTFDVDANTSIDQLSDELNVKLPEVSFSFPCAITNNDLKLLTYFFKVLQCTDQVFLLSKYYRCVHILMFKFEWNGEQGHQYDTVSGFVCEAFGYLPKEGGRIPVILEKDNNEEDNDYQDKADSNHSPDDNHHNHERHQAFEIEVPPASLFSSHTCELTYAHYI